jgi:hypothetical protein
LQRVSLQRVVSLQLAISIQVLDKIEGITKLSYFYLGTTVRKCR